jgi:hypothetical protein
MAYVNGISKNKLCISGDLQFIVVQYLCSGAIIVPDLQLGTLFAVFALLCSLQPCWQHSFYCIIFIRS